MSERSEAEPFPHRNERRDVSEYERELDPDAEYDEPWDPPESDPNSEPDQESVGADDADQGYEDFHDRDDAHRDHSESAEQERETSRGWERHTQAGRLVTQNGDDEDEDYEPDERAEPRNLSGERSGDFRNMSAEESAVHVVEAGHMGYEYEEPYTD